MLQSRTCYRISANANNTAYQYIASKSNNAFPCQACPDLNGLALVSRQTDDYRELILARYGKCAGRNTGLVERCANIRT